MNDLLVTRKLTTCATSRAIDLKCSNTLMFGIGEILEIGAFWSIRTKDVPAFDRYFSQLQTFYNDYA